MNKGDVRLVNEMWQRIVGTLKQRGLVRVRKTDGKRVIPSVSAVLCETEYVAYMLDMQHLGGITREKWLEPCLHSQMRAALGGRPVTCLDTNGLTLIVSRTAAVYNAPSVLHLTQDMIPLSDYTAILGHSPTGVPILLDFTSCTSGRTLLVGGTSGFGKTGTIRSLALQLVQKHTPEQLQLAVIDLKLVDFAFFKRLPHLFADVANEPDTAQALTKRVEREMQRRLVVLESKGLVRWGELPRDDRFPLLLLIVDEVADFAKTKTGKVLIEIARKGRATGIALIVCTQRPCAESLSTQMRANLVTRLAFKTVDHYNSKIVLDHEGAETLRHKGQAIVRLEGCYQNVQTAFIPDDEIETWCSNENVQTVKPFLSEDERQLARYAIEKLDGDFVIGKLYAARQRGELQIGLSKRKIEALARQWEDNGMLAAASSATSPRKIGGMLRSLLGYTPGVENGDTMTVMTGDDRAVIEPKIDGEVPAFVNEMMTRRMTGAVVEGDADDRQNKAMDY